MSEQFWLYGTLPSIEPVMKSFSSVGCTATVMTKSGCLHRGNQVYQPWILLE